VSSFEHDRKVIADSINNNFFIITNLVN